MKPKFFKHRQFLSVAAITVIAMVLVLTPKATLAVKIGAADLSAESVFNTLAGILSIVVIWIANAVSGLILLVMKALFVVIAYTEFIDHPVVTNGWRVVRDIVNTGFIALLLFIALGTIFGIERVKWQQQITKLIIAAIAINFSRLIVGLLIDIGQVVMIAFVNALQATGPANFIDLVGMRNSQALTTTPSGMANQGAGQFMSAIYALAMVTIVLIVMVVIVAVLVYRVIVLWILIILSPAAFLAGAADGMLSQASGIYKKWWGKLTAAIMLGPILTFFIWLSLSSVGNGLTQGFDASSGEISVFLNKAAQGPEFFSFLIGIGLLLAGLEAAQSSASELGGLAEKAVSTGRSMSKSVAKLPSDALGSAAIAGTRKVVTKSAQGARALGAGAGSLYRGITEEQREKNIKERRARERRLSKGNVLQRYRGRRSKQATDTEEKKNKSVIKNLDEENREKFKDHDTEELSEIYSRNKSKRGERSKTEARTAASMLVDDKEKFAEIMSSNPEIGKKMMSDARKHKENIRDKEEIKNLERMLEESYAKIMSSNPEIGKMMISDEIKHKENIGDKEGIKNLERMLEENMSWTEDSSADMKTTLDSMSDKKKKSLNARNFDSPEFRKAAEDSGLLKDLNPTQGRTESGKDFKKRRREARAGYSGDFIRAAKKANKKINKTDTAKEVKRKETVRTALKGADMSKKSNRDRQRSNETLGDLENARIQGNIAEKLETVNLEDIDINHPDIKGNADAEATVDKILDEVITGKSGPEAVQKLIAAKNSDDKDESDRAIKMLEEVNIKVSSASPPTDRNELANLNAMKAALDEDAETTFNYTDAAGFGAGGKSEFQDAFTVSPELSMNISENYSTASGGIEEGNELVGAMTEVIDKKLAEGMLDRHDRSIGTNSESQQKDSIRKVQEILKQGIKDMKKSGASEDAIKEKKAVLKFISKRIIPTINQT